jgi:diamine N-acetyltransferase
MLQSDNIRLRALEPNDIDILYNWENDQEVWHLSNTVTPYSRYLLEQYVINSDQDIYTAKQLRLMIDKTDGEDIETIGAIDLFDFDPVNHRAGVGILIIKNERKKGYAREALEILTNYCFSVLQLHQLYCNITVDNKTSLNLFKKQNFEIIGIKKDWLYIHNKYVDEYILQLVK